MKKIILFLCSFYQFASAQDEFILRSTLRTTSKDLKILCIEKDSIHYKQKKETKVIAANDVIAYRKNYTDETPFIFVKEDDKSKYTIIHGVAHEKITVEINKDMRAGPTRDFLLPHLISDQALSQNYYLVFQKKDSSDKIIRHKKPPMILVIKDSANNGIKIKAKEYQFMPDSTIKFTWYHGGVIKYYSYKFSELKSIGIRIPGMIGLRIAMAVTDILILPRFYIFSRDNIVPIYKWLPLNDWEIKVCYAKSAI